MIRYSVEWFGERWRVCVLAENGKPFWPVGKPCVSRSEAIWARREFEFMRLTTADIPTLIAAGTMPAEVLQ